MTIKSFQRAGFALAAGAFLASGLGSLTAQAAPTIPDAEATANLIIHKYLGSTTSLANDGRTVDPAAIEATGATPLAGVVFDVYQVFYDAGHTNAVDLTTNAGWDTASAIRQAAPTQAEINAGAFVVGGTTYYIVAADQVTTASDGVVSTKDLPIGLYLVNENMSATVALDAAKSSLTPATPFVVTLPMTDPTSQTGWDYTIDVYPKNQMDAITKKVLDGNLNVTNQDAYQVGQQLTYRLDSTVKVSDTDDDGTLEGSEIGYYAVTDQLAPEMSYKSVTLSPVAADGTVGPALVEGTDFKVAYDATSKKVSFSLTASGLDKIANSTALRTDLVAKVETMPDDGIIPNTAAFIPSAAWLVGQGVTPGNPGDTPTPTTPTIKSNEVDTRYGDVVIAKTDENGAPLAGAVFQVFRSGADGVCGNDDIYDAGGDLKSALDVSATTDASGLTKVEGLQLSNWYNGAAVTAAADLHSYCIVETQAPTGYELQAEPIEFDLTVPGSVTDLSAAYNSDARDSVRTDNTGGNLQVENMPHNLENALPLTGGAGTALVGLGGVALIGGAGAVYALKRRREAVADQS